MIITKKKIIFVGDVENVIGRHRRVSAAPQADEGQQPRLSQVPHQGGKLRPQEQEQDGVTSHYSHGGSKGRPLGYSFNGPSF